MLIGHQQRLSVTCNISIQLIKLLMFVYLSVYLSERIFLSHFEIHWDALWHKVAFGSRDGSKTTIFVKTQKMWKRCTKYIIFSRFSQMSRPFRNWFGCLLAWNYIFGPAKVVKHQYLGKRKKCGNAARKTSFWTVFVKYLGHFDIDFNAVFSSNSIPRRRRRKNMYTVCQKKNTVAKRLFWRRVAP